MTPSAEQLRRAARLAMLGEHFDLAAAEARRRLALAESPRTAPGVTAHHVRRAAELRDLARALLEAMDAIETGQLH